MKKMKAKEVHNYQIDLISPEEILEVKLRLYVSEGHYFIMIPGAMAGTLCINDPARFKSIINRMLDDIIEVENNAYDKHHGGLDDIEDRAAQG